MICDCVAFKFSCCSMLVSGALRSLTVLTPLCWLLWSLLDDGANVSIMFCGCPSVRRPDSCVYDNSGMQRQRQTERERERERERDRWKVTQIWSETGGDLIRFRAWLRSIKLMIQLPNCCNIFQLNIIATFFCSVLDTNCPLPKTELFQQRPCCHCFYCKIEQTST